MLTNNPDGSVTVECNGENCTQKLEADDFETAKLLIRSEGWKTTKGEMGYEHLCRECQ